MGREEHGLWICSLGSDGKRGQGLKGSHVESRERQGRPVVASSVELFKKWCSEFIKADLAGLCCLESHMSRETKKHGRV